MLHILLMPRFRSIIQVELQPKAAVSLRYDVIDYHIVLLNIPKHIMSTLLTNISMPKKLESNSDRVLFIIPYNCTKSFI